MMAHRLWQFINRTRLRRDLVIILIAKCILLSILAISCFSAPLTVQMARMPSPYSLSPDTSRE